MRILKISGKNLASLASPFEVDFQQEPLASSGLFAICGPTGAGKSTLLDALCLALYDNTPRLKRAPSRAKMAEAGSDTLTQSDPRNLLSRGANEGFAEVDFIGNDGNAYRARWSVTRARSKSGSGTLKASSMSLLQLPSLQAIGGVKKEVLLEIEQRIGLNFEQFTRAVLLAQNEFAAFLKADDNERGELLQTLTGSALYSEISKRAFERHRQEEKQLQQIKDKLADQTPLADSVRASVEQELSAANLALQQLDARKAALEHEMRLFQDLQRLRLSQNQALQEWQTRQQAQQASSNQAEYLAQVQAVQSARPLLQELERNLQEQTRNQNQIEQAQLASNQAQQAQQVAQQALQQAKLNWQNAEAAQNNAAPQLDQAKELDARLLALAPSHNQAQQQRDASQQAARAAQQAWQEKLAQQEQLQTKQQECQHWLSQHQHIRPLAESWARWETHFSQAARSANEHASLQASVQTARAQEPALEAKEAAAQQALLASQLALGQAEQLKQQAQKALDTLDYAALQKHKQATENRREQVAATQKLWQDILAKQKQEQDLQDKARLSSLEQTHAAQALQAAHKAQPLLASQLQQAEKMEKLALAASTESVQKLRATLEEDAACPVCGSTEHPYRHASPQESAALHALSEEVARCRQLLQENLSEQARQTERQSSQAQQLLLIKEELHSLNTALQAAQHAWQALLSNSAASQQLQDAVSNAPNPEQIAAHWFAQESEEIGQLLQGIREQEQVWQASNQRLQDAQLTLDTALRRQAQNKEELNRAEAVLTQARHSQSVSQQRLQDAEHRLAESLAELDSAFTDEGDWQENWRAAPAHFQAQCQAKVKQWDSEQQRNTQLQASLEKLAIELTALHTQKQQAESEATRANSAYGVSELQIAAMQAERGKLFAGRAVLAVQEELSQAVQHTKTKWSQQQEASQASDLAVGRCNEALAQAQLRRQQLQAEQAQAQSALDAWLANWPHAGEQDGLALLRQLLAHDAAWISTQSRQLQALADALQTAAAILSERSAQVTQQEQTLLSHLKNSVGETAGQELAEVDLSELNAAMQARQAAQQALQLERQAAVTESTRLGLQLAQDDARRKQAEHILQQISAQETIYARWAKLNELIGSADGKKLRNFAQQFTLDVLLGYANRHLREVGRRYRLERNKGTLALLVVDQDMGDEVRSVHSLSGGESFLVSLALALGLASLSSNRVRVESLFIDEGFGSLDADTLRVAMDALDGLQAMGRKVGVISHVQEMTERIAAKISVQRVAGGRSTVKVG